MPAEQKKKVMWKTIKEQFGKVPLCNNRAERAPHIGKFCFPLCWRCVSINSSLIMSYIILDIANVGMIITPVIDIIIAITGIFPCIIDGIAQQFFNRESTNSRRIVFGIFAGISMSIAIIHFPITI